MATLEEARVRLEAALERLEAAVVRQAESVGEEDTAALRRRCSALDLELQRAGRDNQRLRDALAEAIARSEAAAQSIDDLLGSV